jgi:hypothetical protein
MKKTIPDQKTDTKKGDGRVGKNDQLHFISVPILYHPHSYTLLVVAGKTAGRHGCHVPVFF